MAVNFQNQVVSVKELLLLLKEKPALPVAIQGPNPENPPRMEVYYLMPEYNTRLEDVVNENPYGHNITYVGTYNYTTKEMRAPTSLHRNGRINFSAGHTLHLLTGLQGNKMLEDYGKNQAKNLTFLLQRSWMQVGADPEFFVSNEEGKIVPAWELFPEKSSVEVESPYWDGFQGEFNIHSDSCLAFMVDSVQNSLYNIYRDISTTDRGKFGKLQISLASLVEVESEILQTAEQKFIELGCKPSLNAYGLEPIRMPARLMGLRPAGGHIHIGVDNPRIFSLEQYREAVKGMDAVLGVACVSLFANYDDPRRRMFYGLPGEYRLPKHGLEYRVLSNAWLMHPVITHIVYELARVSFNFGILDLRSMWDASEEETISVIRNCDVDGARRILERNHNTFLNILKAAPPFTYIQEAELVANIFKRGVDEYIANPHDIFGNWKITKNGWLSHSGGTNACFTNSLGALAAEEKI